MIDAVTIILQPIKRCYYDLCISLSLETTYPSMIVASKEFSRDYIVNVGLVE